MKSIPVVDLGENKIDSIITQSAVIHMLEECAGLHWFESWGSKKLYELGLPLMIPSQLIKVLDTVNSARALQFDKKDIVYLCVFLLFFSLLQVYEDEPVLQAFKLMRQKGIGGLPVVSSNGKKAIGNISIRDIQYLLLAPEIYKDFRFVRFLSNDHTIALII